ncbi:MAG: alcohol dehydrogenase catalytic domain-containing protein [Bdellovibrionota bacterium]
MKACVYTESRDLQVLQVQTPGIAPGELLMRVAACGVCGTDVQKIQFSTATPPLVLGHEVSGWVEQVGQGVHGFSKGDRIVVAHHTPCYACHYCKHGNVSMCKTFKQSNLDPGGYAEFLRIPAVHVQMTTHKIPDHVSFQEAIYMEPLACVLRNIKRAQLIHDDVVLVIGLGSVGLLTSMALKALGMRVIGADLKSERRTLAQSVGIDEVVDGDADQIHRAVFSMTGGRGVDLAVLTAGNEDVYANVISHVRDGGKINLFAGLSPQAMLKYNVNEVFKRELTIYSSYSPSPIELLEAMDMISRKQVLVSVIGNQTYGLDQIPAAIEDVISQKVMKAIIQP